MSEPQNFSVAEVNEAAQLSQDMLQVLKGKRTDGAVALLAIAMLAVTGITNAVPDDIEGARDWMFHEIGTKVSLIAADKKRQSL